jgi:hypothetical protein
VGFVVSRALRAGGSFSRSAQNGKIRILKILFSGICWGFAIPAQARCAQGRSNAQRDRGR